MLLRLLVSVTNKKEALEAIKGGAHIIDVKNPREGSLGANFPRIIKQVRKIVPTNIEVSATIGDLPNLPGTASLAALGAAVSGADYVKAGLFGVKKVEEAVSLMNEVCRAVKDYNAALKVIAAGYADFQEVDCLNPLELPHIAHKTEADGVLLDIKVKGPKKLFGFLSDDTLRNFVEESHKYGLMVALAGGLDKEDIPRLLNLRVDVVGIRRAVCSPKDRVNGEVQSVAVMEFTKMINEHETK
jgi:hypothetical protein